MSSEPVSRTSSPFRDWTLRAIDRHAEQATTGLHDAACEWRASHRTVGPLPRRTCALCKAADHNLAPTYEVAVSVVGCGPMAPVRVAAPRRRKASVTQARASRAGALPPEAVEAQKKAAGVR